MVLRQLLTRLVLVCFGIGLAVLIAEIMLRLLYPTLPQNLQIALRDVRLTPFTDTRLAPPPVWRPDERYQYIVRPGVDNLMQAGSPTVLFPVSSFAWWGGRVGFRSPQPLDGTVPAVAVGDSHTFCFTSVEDCWVTVLSREMGIPFSNLGQPVTGSVSHARIFFDFVAKPELALRQPKLVLWQFFGNDFNDDYGLALSEGTAYTPPETKNVAANDRVPIPQWLLQNSAVLALIDALTTQDPGVEMFTDPFRVIEQGIDISFGQSYIRDSFDMTLARNLEGEQLSQQAILETHDLVLLNGGAFVIILVPTKEEVYRRLTESQLGEAQLSRIAEPRQRLLNFCSERQLVCLDLLPALQTAAETNVQLFFPTDSHLNAQGNQTVAAVVAQFLREQKLLQ